jgi:glycosyltransferase involved in cell wall biosynthesis
MRAMTGGLKDMNDTEPLRVLHVTNRWEIGGTNRHIHDLAAAMRERGLRVDIAAWRQTPTPTFLDETVIRLPLYSQGGTRKSLRGLLRSVRQLRGYLRDERVAVVHTHGRLLLPLIRLAARSLPVAHVHTEHNPFPRTVPFLRYPAHVICPTNAVRDTFTATVPHPEQHTLHVIHHGIDHASIRTLRATDLARSPDAPPFLIFLGRHTADKGGQVLIEALRLLDERGRLQCDTHFYGAGDEKGVWMERVRELGLYRRIHFHAPTPEPLGELLMADIAVFPSNEMESFGYAFVEAAALGLRVIAGDIPAFRELRDLGVPCRLVPHQDASALADALETEIAAMRHNGGTRNLALDSSLLSIKEMVDRTLEVYERAMGG